MLVFIKVIIYESMSKTFSFFIYFVLLNFLCYNIITFQKSIDKIVDGNNEVVLFYETAYKHILLFDLFSKTFYFIKLQYMFLSSL